VNCLQRFFVLSFSLLLVLLLHILKFVDNVCVILITNFCCNWIDLPWNEKYWLWSPILWTVNKRNCFDWFICPMLRWFLFVHVYSNFRLILFSPILEIFIYLLVLWERILKMLIYAIDGSWFILIIPSFVNTVCIDR